MRSHPSDARSGSLQNRRGSSVSMAAADPLGDRRNSRGGSPSPLRGSLSSSPLRSAVVSAPPPVSKHAAAVAETVYAAAAQALLLLCSLAPEVCCGACACRASYPCQQSQACMVFSLPDLCGQKLGSSVIFCPNKLFRPFGRLRSSQRPRPVRRRTRLAQQANSKPEHPALPRLDVLLPR